MPIFVHYFHVFPSKFAKKSKKNLQNTILVMRAVMRNKDIIWSGLRFKHNDKSTNELLHRPKDIGSRTQASTCRECNRLLTINWATHLKYQNLDNNV